MSYIDEIAVARRCEGDLTVSLDRAEAAEAFRRLRAQGMSLPEVADRLGVHFRTVRRWNSGSSRMPYSLRPKTSGVVAEGEAAATPGNLRKAD